MRSSPQGRGRKIWLWLMQRPVQLLVTAAMLICFAWAFQGWISVRESSQRLRESIQRLRILGPADMVDLQLAPDQATAKAIVAVWRATPEGIDIARDNLRRDYRFIAGYVGWFFIYFIWVKLYEESDHRLMQLMRYVL